MVGRRPKSVIHKVGNSDISDPNRHVIDVVSVQLTPSHSLKNFEWRYDYLLLQPILKCLAVLGLRVLCFLVVKADPIRLGFLVCCCMLWVLQCLVVLDLLPRHLFPVRSLSSIWDIGTLFLALGSPGFFLSPILRHLSLWRMALVVASPLKGTVQCHLRCGIWVWRHGKLDKCEYVQVGWVCRLMTQGSRIWSCRDRHIWAWTSLYICYLWWGTLDVDSWLRDMQDHWCWMWVPRPYVH